MPRLKDKLHFSVETLSKEMIVSDGTYVVHVEIGQDHINIVPVDQQSFCFKSKNNLKTIKRWKSIIALMQKSIDVLAKERKI